MPLWSQPRLRFLNEVWESSGRYKTLDSKLVAELKIAEAAQTKKKTVPVAKIWYEGSVYTAS